MTISTDNLASTKRPSIGIIGCGWLGTALARQLQHSNYIVKATTASMARAEELNAQGIDTEILSLPLTEVLEKPLSVFSMHTLIICIPPRLKQGLTNYADNVANIVALAEKYEVKKLIMISSSAVYNGLSGKVDETSLLDFSANKVKSLHDAEQMVIAFTGNKNILRLSGLVGPKRHPGRFLSASKLHNNGSSQVNLIHQSDAVGLIVALINNDEPCDVNNVADKVIFNGVSSTDCSRKVFYQAATKALDLDIPNFEPLSVEKPISFPESKQVIGKKAVDKLKYNYIHADLLTWVQQNA
jgi:nucleoside-diphosphate-sugar epimerase